MQEPNVATAILDAIDEPALIVRRGMVEGANNAALALLGQQMVGRDLRFAIRHPVALNTILAGRTADLELVGVGSAERPWHMSVRPLPGGALVRLSDRSVLRAAERMRTDFVANASHELRTPLATIIGYAETLIDEGPVDHQTRNRFGATIQSEARRMLRIVEDLMSLSRIEADRYRTPDERIDLGEVARIAMEHAVTLAERRGCRLDSAIESNLPMVLGDFGQLLQLADNLIGNAIRYGCSDKACTATMSVRCDGQRVIMTVSDQGEGIAAEHLPRLTERFYRVDSARSRESGGTGLGLAIVKHIVERHRGTLEIQSEPGKGTQVAVSLHAV
ncbi:MAG: ATP-binding protein [Pseudomonadota bacterium]|nr:ATP-binding protein [Pseudomonadota bacterium]